MKKKIFSILAGLACAVSAYAVPAHPGLCKVLQPDGTYVTVQLRGDEFLSYTTTADGYTVERNAEGYYVYVNEANGNVAKTSIVAHDAAVRGASETAFLKKTARGIVSQEAAEAAQAERIKADIRYAKNAATTKAAIAKAAAKPKNYDYNNFRGLVILVEYSDCPFSRTDAKEIFTNMLSQSNFEGIPSASNPAEIIPYTGSVRDYFYDSSMEKFDPQFDVVGPVKINYTKTYAQATKNAPTLMVAAVNASNSQVDFSQYDGDGDGEVDMVYFIFSGHGSNFYGNNSNLIWPHASYFWKKVADGKYLGRYACSTELYGQEGSGVIDGIGTICHEFSHVLGLMDEYDTDYSGSGGESITPGRYSVMSGGSYFNYSRTPVGYSIFQRYQSGFAVPTTITEKGTYTLHSLDDTAEGYRINSPVNKEYFLLENRRINDSWNAYIPGQGMLVYRVDSTSTAPWSYNQINANPAHNYYELIRAKLASDGSDSASDPFPGSANVTSLVPKTWAGRNADFGISGIKEDADGTITFSTNSDMGEVVEDFEDIPVFTTNANGVQGKFAQWDFVNAVVGKYAASICNGQQAAGVKGGGCIIMSNVKAENINCVSFNFWNGNFKTAKVHLYSSIDNGATWTEVFPSSDNVPYSVGSRGSDLFSYAVDFSNQDVSFKIEVDKTSGSARCQIDDVTISYAGNDFSAVEDVAADVAAADFKVAVAGTTMTVTGTADEAIEVYDASGVLMATAGGGDGVATFTIELPEHGFYIVRQGRKSQKVVL